MSLSQVALIGFPEHQASELRVQFGRILPDTRIEELPDRCLDELAPDALILVWDSVTAPALVRRLFAANPQASVVVLAGRGDADRGSELMALGAMDYRLLPCPDEVLEIYVRKSGHQTALATEAGERRRQGEDPQSIFVTEDLETRRLLDQVALIAPSNASVLVIGESGTGKERLSRYIHACSDRRDASFVAINCAAIPEGVLEAELFGHEKGAFTGATTARPGKFELAHGGTLLLDEITEMPVHLQAKLLRVLQEGEVDRLGGRKPVKVDVRVIATSNRDIEQAVREGQFRQDLYYRLNVVTIQLPPLRRRPDDIGPLARHFLSRFSEMYGRPAPELGSEALERLRAHDWPGNARELENCMHRAFLMAMGQTIRPEHLGLPEKAPSATAPDLALSPGMSIRDMERALIERTLEHVRGNRTEAARLLGISIRTLRNKLNSFASADGTELASGTQPHRVGETSWAGGTP